MNESKGQAWQIIDTIPILAWSARPDGTADFFNRRWLEYTGLSTDQALDWGWKIAIHPDDLPRMLEIFQDALNFRRPFEVEARLRRCDGEFRWFLFRGSPLLDGSGKVVRWYGTNTDLEDRKRVEDQLQETMSERTRLAAVRAEIAMALADKDTLKGILHRCAETMVRHLDAAFARIWTLRNAGAELELEASAGMYTRLDGGFSRIPVGQMKIGLIAQERKAHLTNDVQNDPRICDRNWAVAEKMQSFAGYPLVVEDRVVGVMGMFSRRALTESTLETLAFIADGIAQGIERKRAEEALRGSEESLRLTLDSIGGMVTTRSASGNLELANRRFLDYTGCTLDELKDNRAILHRDDRARVLNKWAHSLRTGDPLYFEARIRRRDGVFRS
jgi:PAS domain S-box-containing protein